MKRRTIVDSLSLPSSPIGIMCQIERNQLWLQNYQLSHAFLWPIMWNNSPLHMLNHIARVSLKRHFFSVCCHAAASTAFLCVAVWKTPPSEKVEIDNLYSRGNVDQLQKMGLGRMLEWLKTRRPNQMDLQIESKIKQCAVSLTVKFKKHNTIATMKRGT